jgi:hypothetical protein
VCSRGGVAPQPVVGGAGGDIAGLRYSSPDGAPPLEKNIRAMSDIWSPKITAIVSTKYCNHSFSYGVICVYVAPTRDQCTGVTVVGITYQSTGNGHMKATNMHG